MSEDTDRRGRGETALKTRERTKKPRLYKVILHNDDFTTQEFVVAVLVQFFYFPVPEATRLMLEVHMKGSAVAGAFPYDVAESKVARVTHVARESGHPLKLTMEPE